MISQRTMLGLVFGFLIQACHPVIAQNVAPWRVLKTSWSVQDEKNFQSFVQVIGQAVENKKCRSVSECLTSSINPYYPSDPKGLRYYADCADFPYYLRAYFAFKNGLPFSMATSMKLRNVPGNRGEIRYSAYGNDVSSKFSTVSNGSSFPDAILFLNQTVPYQTNSGNFRTFYKGNDTGDLFTDFYPVRLDRNGVQVGTMLYDPNGHVTVVYKITDDGKIYYVDAHPDNSLTTGSFSVKFIRSHPGQGAGFKNWRPIQLVGAKQNNQGFWIGGKIQATPNNQIPNYGIEQFYGNQNSQPDWTKGKFIHEGKTVSYYDYVRIKMAVGNLKIYPIDDFRNTLQDLCQSLEDRVLAVDAAIKAGIQNKPHPPRLPENIYGTQGEWETYSTPSRDAQLKVSFRDLIDQADSYRKKIQNGDPSIVYTGTNLFQDLLDVYQSEANSCQIRYVNSVGTTVTLNLEQVRQRLFKLSFDPYHCVELRWGAYQGPESATCADSENKKLWYVREQRLRNQHQRSYEIKMDFSLEDLAKPLPGNGIAEPMDVDIVRFLQN